MPSVAVVLNGISRKKEYFLRTVYPALALSQKANISLLETAYAGHARELAARAAHGGADVVIAAGGDGTLHDVVNGIVSTGNHSNVAIGVVPLGTGNDFAKTCGVTSDPGYIADLVAQRKSRMVDVWKLACLGTDRAQATRYFINACSIGLGPATVQRLLSSKRRLGPAITYWKAIVGAFFNYVPEEIHCNAGNWSYRGKVRAFVIANGKSFGNGLVIAPEAKPDDATLNVFAAGAVPLLNFLIYQQQLKSAKTINDSLIKYYTAAKLSITSPGRTLIETEGELAGYLPAHIERAGQVRFLC